MKTTLFTLLLLIASCTYTKNEAEFSINSNPKPEIHLYMEDEILAFLEKDDISYDEKQYTFTISATIIDNPNDTTFFTEKAEIKLHGGSTIKYKKKSIAIDLKDNRKYFNFPYDTDEFFLITMAEDTGYIRNLIGYTTLRELGLFNNHFEMVHIYMNDIYKGIYLIVEKTQNAIQNNKGGISTIFRRNYGPLFEFSYSASHLNDSEVETERSRLQSVYDVVGKFTGRALRDSLHSLIDIPQYCRWLALNTVFKNGDYLDELFFYQQDVDGNKQFKINAWDYDDLFNPPHWGNDYTTSLIYCNEDPLDVAIGSDSTLYDIFKQELNSIVNSTLTDTYLQNLKQFLSEYVQSEFSNPSVSDIMNNFSSSSETAEEELSMLIDFRFNEIFYRRDSIRTVLFNETENR
jgi:hypothetical protein